MKILLFGKSGQVGWELQRSLAPLGEVVALDRNSHDFCGDLSNLDGIATAVRAVRPDVIVNAAAHTAVDKAESEADLARTINTHAPECMAQEAAKLGAWLVHYSTDYVFDGSGDKPWVETDTTNPLSVYGTTKRDGEDAIKASGCKHLIFRTSWVYGARGKNFAKTMLKLAQDRDKLTIIDDQFGAPTGADLLADATAHAIRVAQVKEQACGLYHLVAGGEVTWHRYASFVINLMRDKGMPIKVSPESILPVTTSAFPTPAKRPHNSRLNTSRFRKMFGLTLPQWQTGVVRMLSEVYDSQP